MCDGPISGSVVDGVEFSAQNGTIMSGIRFALAALMCCALVPSAFAGHTLTTQEQRILAAWLSRNPHFRLAVDADCVCSEDIRQTKAGSGGVWQPIPGYHPYVATGDFNADGVPDFAVAVIDRTKTNHQFAILVFNGPFDSDAVEPAFVASGLDLRYMGLFFGPPRPKPYRLIVGRFGTDNTSTLVPQGETYKLR
jgi:hypothetical protein